MSEKKKTLVLGASINPERYSYKAIHRLVQHGHPVVAIGMSSGEVAGIHIEQVNHIYKDIDTITLYVGPLNQPFFYNYIIDTKPKRIIFNPGTENQELLKLAVENGIETELACTLVLLSVNNY
ncbi:CoA-binding protein [Solitalea koreensis]|uniref:CoA-binding domain-containing protein n=1 Tax=Solitalea koreensis TaxID=543615 RepID=A0A521CSE5_9SPHI|nr:CoA-binding protein [Solitalea koreensis]SMO62419.1 hypothetical protein SAMN06265350_104329 [Solitalea koreensis]